MLPHLAPVQAPVAVPVVVSPPPAVNVPLVAAGVQQLVGQVQDLIIQNVAIVQPPVAMEVEGENEIFKRLFLKRFGRELPEQERNDVDDINMNLIDLTKEDDDEMEVATPAAVVVVVKTEAPEAPETPETPETPMDGRRRSSRLERASLRKTEVIQEKEAPLAAGTENVIADTDEDMAEDVSNVNPESGKTYEEIMADIDAAIEDNSTE